MFPKIPENTIPYILNPIKYVTPQFHTHLKGNHQKQAGIVLFYPALSDWGWEQRGGHGAYFIVTKSGDESRLDTDRTVSTVVILCVTRTSEKFPWIGNGHNIWAFSKTKRTSHSSIVNATPESNVRIRGTAPTAFSA